MNTIDTKSITPTPTPEPTDKVATEIAASPGPSESPVLVALKRWAEVDCADPVVAATAAQLAEIAASKLLSRALEVLGWSEEYGECSAEELASEIFGCVADELHGQDVADWAAEILEEYQQQKKSK